MCQNYFLTFKRYKMKLNITLLLVLLLGMTNLNAQEKTETVEKTDMEQITATLMDYIEGSTGGQPERLKKAFHPNLNLYYTKAGELKTWSGKAYIADTKEGQPTGEIGKIISIDYENDIAVAKVQIADSEGSTPYIDYFMLVKIKDHWTIVHKMFTKRVKE